MNENPKARQLFQDAFAGRSSRRDVLKRAAAIGLAAPVAASLANIAHVASVKAAVDAGSRAAAKVGELVSSHVIARPHEDLVRGFIGENPKPAK